MQQDSSMKNQYVLHYMDVRAITAGEITMDSIKQKSTSYLLTATLRDCRKIVAFLKRREILDRLNPQVIRLYIPQTPEWPAFYMDQNGRVFDGESTYLLNPYAFLKVVDYMDYLKKTNGIREGVPSFR